jgi:predicted phosphodiesterase
MKIRIISDLHLEYNDFPKFLKDFTILKPVDVLILAGDVVDFPNIEMFKTFIKSIRSYYSEIIFVLGNHEYYENTVIDNVILVFRDLCQELSVKLLENETVVMGGITFLGSTLWSPVKREFYREIKRNWILEQNQTATDFIYKNPADIIITHHMPDSRFIPEKYQKMDELNSAYTNDGFDFDRLVNLGTQYWIFGHTHTHVKNVTYNGITFICNPLGYKHENNILEDVVIEV